jgi:polyphosphate kinase 2 (PPK2 family)
LKALIGRLRRCAPKPAGTATGRTITMAKSKAREKKVAEGVEHLQSKLRTRDYDSELAKLHVELVKLQQWVVHKGHKDLHCF